MTDLQAGSEFGMEAQGEKRHRAAGEIIAGIVDKLIIGGDVDSVGDRVLVISFENALSGVGRGAVAQDDKADAAGGTKIRMRVRNSVENTADADLVPYTPSSALLSES
jgi:hypothetical protein